MPPTSDTLSPDEVREALRGDLAEAPGIAEVRRLRAAGAENAAALAGFDRDRWATLAQRGLAAMGAPEEWDGLGMGAGHLVTAVEECGASLHPGPVRATQLLTWSLTGVSPNAVSAPLTTAIAGVLGGELVAGLADDRPARAAFADDAVTGVLSAVTHGAVADVVVAVVDTPQGPAAALILVDGGIRQDREALDLATPRADVHVTAAPAVLLTHPADPTALETWRTRSRLLLAAEQVGGAQACLTAMVAYTQIREQFGVLIGTYQAIQHLCSRTAIDVVGARALVVATAAALDGEDPQAHVLGRLAAATAGDTFLTASSSFIRLSGGIGFTWEHDAHLFFRRARASAAADVSPEQQRHAAVEADCLDLLTATA